MSSEVRKMLVESLYPEFCNQAGDNGNMMYVRACLPDAEVVETHLMDRPAFADRRPDLIYLGCMTEVEQARVAAALMPYRDRLVELIEDGVTVLATGNATELLGMAIEDVRDGVTPCLGILPFTTARDMETRYKRMVMGTFEGHEVIGFKAQFTQAHGDNATEPFFKVERGFGLCEGSELEGFRHKNLVATWLLGPLLPTNPHLMRWLLDTMGAPDAPVAFWDTALAAYEARLEEFRDPGVEVID